MAPSINPQIDQTLNPHLFFCCWCRGQVSGIPLGSQTERTCPCAVASLHFLSRGGPAPCVCAVRILLTVSASGVWLAREVCLLREWTSHLSDRERSTSWTKPINSKPQYERRVRVLDDSTSNGQEITTWPKAPAAWVSKYLGVYTQWTITAILRRDSLGTMYLYTYNHN